MIYDATIKKENQTRNDYLDDVNYDPLTGQGSFQERYKISYNFKSERSTVYLPMTCKDEALINHLTKHKYNFETASEALDIKDDLLFKAFMELRNRHDFEFWAITAVIIQDKETKEERPFKLRLAQRLLLSRLEKMRLAGIPIRVILLKARQWGGSTLVQIYMAWIQIMHKENWHMAVVAQVEDQAKGIRGMYSRLAKKYPKDLGRITIKPYEGSSKNKIGIEHGGILSIGSAEQPDTIRSQDLAMLHLSEVGLWGTTKNKSGDDLAQSLRGALTDVPYSVCVMESTAKGVGNFFHREWQKAEKGESNYIPEFIAWFQIDMYRHSVDTIIADYGSIDEFVASWSDYEKQLWNWGATIQGIAWYRWKLRDMGGDTWRMQSEYPSNAGEAFQSTGDRIFAPAYVHNLRETIMQPVAVGNLIGDAHKGPDSLNNITFVPQKDGKLWIWRFPHEVGLSEADKKAGIVGYRNQTCSFADVGGRTETADKSTVTVMDRYCMIDGGVPEVVAEYRGNLDQDLFAWDAVRLSKWYHNALFAIEVNSLRSNQSEDGEHSMTVLDEIKYHYNNLFKRISPEKINQQSVMYPGFHTNSGTKEMIINTLNACARDRAYIERSERLCSEMDTYERKPDGRMGAVDGAKDDLVISRAGAVWLATKYMGEVSPIYKIDNSSGFKQRTTEAVF